MEYLLILSFSYRYLRKLLIDGKLNNMPVYIDHNNYTEHNPHFSDDVSELNNALAKPIDDADYVNYETCHRLLAEGNFVLSLCEGHTQQKPTSFFDLYRLEEGKIVEHWDTTEAIPPKSEWKNDNGKF